MDAGRPERPDRQQRKRRLWHWAGCLCALGALLPKAMGQGPPGLSLIWDAPRACPTAPQIEAAVRSHLGDASAAQSIQVRAHARIREQTSGGFSLSLDVRAARSKAHRELNAEQCGTLAAATALLIALTFDAELHPGGADGQAPGGSAPPGRAPTEGADGSAAGSSGAVVPAAPDTGTATAVTRGGDSSGAPVAAPGEATESPPAGVATPTPSTPTPDARSATSGAPPAISAEPAAEDAATATESGGTESGTRPQLQVMAGLEGSLGFGILPHAPAAGITAAVDVRFAFLRAELAVTFWPGQHRDFARLPLEAGGDGGDAQANLAAFSVDGQICYDVAISVMSFGPCVAAEVGRIFARSSGIALPTAKQADVFALGGGAQARIPLTRRFSMLVDIALLSPVGSRPQFYVQTGSGRMTVHTVGPATFRAAGGVAYVFP